MLNLTDGCCTSPTGAEPHRRVLNKWRQIARISFVTIWNFDLENVGQSRRVQLLQWSHSMKNIKIYRSRLFELPLTISEIITFEIVDLEKSRSRSHSTTFAMTPFDGNYTNLWKSCEIFFLVVDLIVSGILMFERVAFEKIGQDQDNFDSKYHNL